MKWVNQGRNQMCCRIEREIDDVVDIMKDNIDKTMQRGDRLDDLQDKSGTLAVLSFLQARLTWKKSEHSNSLKCRIDE